MMLSSTSKKIISEKLKLITRIINENNEKNTELIKDELLFILEIIDEESHLCYIEND